MKLSTRMTIAMVALVLLTALSVGWLSYLSVVTAALPRVAERVSVHVRLLAGELESYVRGPREDIVGFRSAVGLEEIVRATIAGDPNGVDGATEATWRQRLGARFAAELAAKPDLDEIRVIAVDGEELVRADRFGEGGAIRVVPTEKLQNKTDRKFFHDALAAPANGIYVSPVELTPERSTVRSSPMPILRVAAVVLTPDQKPFGIVVINVDMRPIFRHLAESAQPYGQIFVVDDRGNYLLHPDASRTFSAKAAVPSRWQSDFPDLAAGFSSSDATTALLGSRAGESMFAGIAPAILAGGPRVAVMETIPKAMLMAPTAAVGRSTLLVSLASVLCAGVIAALLARSLTSPLVQMTQAVEAFSRDRSVKIPSGGANEIGVLANAFARMMNEVREKTATLQQEIYEHRRTEAELERHADRERLFSAAVQSSQDAVVTMTLGGLVTGWNPAAEHLFGWTSAEMFGRSIDVIVPDDRRIEVRDILEKIRRGDSVNHHETVRQSRDHRRVEVSLSVSPIKLPSGSIIGACKIARDVTESNEAKKLFEQESDERRRLAEVLNNTITSMVDAVLVADRDANILLANPTAERLMSITTGMSLEKWSHSQQIFKSDGMTVLPLEQRPLMRAIRGEVFDNYEVVVRRNDGKLSSFVTSGRPIHRNSQDRPGALVVYRDVTDAKETERQLRQSQKMEAVGQLTGGIAHDFNNILTVITGTIEILADGVSDRPRLTLIAKMIDDAAERGSQLTRHLLAFSRKQPLQPRETNVNELMIETGRLLRPALGEHIEIESMLEDGTVPALIDPTQLTTAILNLAFNARDAMPNGGKLTFETDNVVLDENYANINTEVQPGPHVMIAVSDTGSGIPAAILDKVFEPFFTTKEVGKGTGLGLSMVYGFIKQSGGHIKICSEEGFGTAVKMYLPCATELGRQSLNMQTTEPISGGEETILVVEDDALVRNYVIAQVKALGYNTLAATNAIEALAFIEIHPEIDLLFTDIVMPGNINGRQLADEAVKRRPELKVLFTSGFTESAVVHHGRLDPGVMLLAKPYRKSDLAHMLRTALVAEPNFRVTTVRQTSL